MNNLFSQRLKVLRTSKGLKQSEISTKLEITERGYRNYELNKREPSLNVLIQLADILNVSVDYLLGRTDNPEINK